MHAPTPPDTRHTSVITPQTGSISKRKHATSSATCAGEFLISWYKVLQFQYKYDTIKT